MRTLSGLRRVHEANKIVTAITKTPLDKSDKQLRMDGEFKKKKTETETPIFTFHSNPVTDQFSNIHLADILILLC